MKKPKTILYDTTLRDGAQGEQINFSAEEKLRILQRLDDLGFPYVEGGWPGANPKDLRFFALARGVSLRNARLAAFGSTRKPGGRAERCPRLRALLQAETPTVAVFGKAWDLHVTDILGIPLAENVAMVRDSIAYLKRRGREVVFDAEHFFDGFKRNRAYACRILEAAQEAGADWIVLCDTNGGSLPHEVTDIVAEVQSTVPATRLGIHVHNDGGLAVANSLAAVQKGVAMVQGTVNGFGERCGNADLLTIAANLQLKMGRTCLPEGSIRQLTHLSHFVSDVANIPPLNSRPFVGRSAFAHKGGMHVNGIVKNPLAYEHIPPERVGNQQRVLVSDMAGKSSIDYKARELGIDLGQGGRANRRIVRAIKDLENQGFQFDAADGSLAVLMRKITGQFQEPFCLECFNVANAKTKTHPCLSLATIKISVGDEEELTAAEGNGPVNALDHALRKALVKFYPRINEMHLVDFKVRTLEGSEGTAARVRVLIDSRDEDETWSTVGVSGNIIEASWHALVDSIQYKLSKDSRHGEARTAAPTAARVNECVAKDQAI